MYQIQRSEQLFKQAELSIPGGVNSPVRAFNSVGGTPLFIKQAKGAYVFDADNNKYIDYVGSWGPMILGHAHQEVVAAVQQAATLGLSYGAPTEVEILLAEKVKNIFPSIELIRMVSSGTEATMSAIRLARAYTKRNKIIKFAGCYHGHTDSLLVDAGSGVLTLGIPNSHGIPAAVTNDSIVLEFNNREQVAEIFNTMGAEIAAIIVEPIAGNMNCVIPDREFLQTLRDLCDNYNSVLIFDEVMTGFRVALGGAQEYFNIKPDLTTLGKIIGGGMPVGAFGGKKTIMQNMAPSGDVYQAGTLSGNPLAMIAGLTTLQLITQPDFHSKLDLKAKKLMLGIKSVAEQHKMEVTYNQIGGMFGLFFTNNKVKNFADVKQSNVKIFNKFFHSMLELGVYFAPSAFEAGFISAAHTDVDIEHTIKAAEQVFATI